MKRKTYWQEKREIQMFLLKFLVYSIVFCAFVELLSRFWRWV